MLFFTKVTHWADVNRGNFAMSKVRRELETQQIPENNNYKDIRSNALELTTFEREVLNDLNSRRFHNGVSFIDYKIN